MGKFPLQFTIVLLSKPCCARHRTPLFPPLRFIPGGGGGGQNLGARPPAFIGLLPYELNLI